MPAVTGTDACKLHCTSAKVHLLLLLCTCCLAAACRIPCCATAVCRCRQQEGVFLLLLVLGVSQRLFANLGIAVDAVNQRLQALKVGLQRVGRTMESVCPLRHHLQFARSEGCRETAQYL